MLVERGPLSSPMRTTSRAAVLSAAALVPFALTVPRAAWSQARPALRVATDPYDSFAEGYYAADLGFFQKAGLDVEVLTFTNGAAISTAVASGAAEIGISNPIQLANAIGHGVPFTLIAGGGMYSSTAPTTVLCVSKNSALRSASGLDGKTVAVSGLKNTDEAALRGWLASHGGASVRMRLIELPFAEMGAALERGTIDAAVIAEPSLAAALEHGGIRIFGKPFDAIAPQFLIGAWFTTLAYARANAATVRNFVATIYQTARWANKNPAASAEILAKHAKLLPETTRAMTRVVYAESLTPALIQPALDLSYKYGVIDRAAAAAEMIAR
jgi:NitT/TauT family transport system substrate-binding protein